MSNQSGKLVPVTVRLPASLVDQWKAEAAAADRTLTDIIRVHVSEETVKPLDKSRRTKRKQEPMLELPEGDKAIIAGLRRIGASLNQIAVVCGRWPPEVGSKALRRVGALNREMETMREAICTRNS